MQKKGTKIENVILILFWLNQYRQPRKHIIKKVWLK